MFKLGLVGAGRMGLNHLRALATSERVRVVAVADPSEQARRSLFEYLEVYYNRQRRHSTLGYVSPLMYEQFEKQRTLRNV